MTTSFCLLLAKNTPVGSSITYFMQLISSQDFPMAEGPTKHVDLWEVIIIPNVIPHTRSRWEAGLIQEGHVSNFNRVGIISPTSSVSHFIMRRCTTFKQRTNGSESSYEMIRKFWNMPTNPNP
jgi:hypothetical protein